MKVTETKLSGVRVIEPAIFGDQRGCFIETFQEERYKKMAKIEYSFVQDNYSRSVKNVLRGLHFQIKNPQGKLVRVADGSVYDVVVDINPSSATFREYVGIELNSENHKQLWIPPGYAHGFCVLSDTAIFEYKCTDYYNPKDEGCILWCDSEIGILWPTKQPIVSKKDSNGLTISEWAFNGKKGTGV